MAAPLIPKNAFGWPTLSRLVYERVGSFFLPLLISNFYFLPTRKRGACLRRDISPLLVIHGTNIPGRPILRGVWGRLSCHIRKAAIQRCEKDRAQNYGNYKRSHKDEHGITRLRYFKLKFHAQLDTAKSRLFPRAARAYANPFPKHSAQYPPTSVRDTVTFILKSRSICAFSCSYSWLSNSRTLPHFKHAT